MPFHHDHSCLQQRLPSPDRPARVLCAEGDEGTREFMQSCLEAKGLLVTAAEDGLKAWGFLQSADFDVLVTAHRMPGLTGLQLAAQAHRAGVSLPIVLMTGSLADITASEPSWRLLTALLLKPFDPPHLLAVVRHALGTSPAPRSPLHPGFSEGPSTPPFPPDSNVRKDPKTNPSTMERQNA